MQSEIKQVENKIAKIINSEYGARHRLFGCVSDIRTLPIDDYDELVDGCRSGQIGLKLAPRSTSSTLFRMIAPKADKSRFTIYAMAALAAPPAGIVLSIMYSAWFLLLLLCVPIFIKILRIHYRKVVLNLALRSELIFCYLFGNRYIAIEMNDGRILAGHNFI